MPTRRSEDEERIFLDLNAVVIAMLEDHPGHEYVMPYVRQGFKGESELFLFDYYPFRAQHILTNHYDVDTHRARNTVQRFVRQPLEIATADRETILAAYEVSAEKNHDVYDCFLVALARRYDVDVLLTTDEDFDALCRDEPFRYRNPVPDEVLEQFSDGR